MTKRGWFILAFVVVDLLTMIGVGYWFFNH